MPSRTFWKASFQRGRESMAEGPTVREFLEQVMHGRDRRLTVSLLSGKEYRMLRDIVTATMSKELFSAASQGAPSHGVILILQGKGEEILDKAIEAVEKMIEVYDTLQEIPFKVSVYSTTLEPPGVAVRLDLDTLDVRFSIPCQDRFRTGTEATLRDELMAALDGLRKTKEKLKEILKEMEKPVSEPLAYIYTRGIIEEIGK
jgi:hypothetical protein